MHTDIHTYIHTHIHTCITNIHKCGLKYIQTHDEVILTKNITSADMDPCRISQRNNVHKYVCIVIPVSKTNIMRRQTYTFIHPHSKHHLRGLGASEVRPDAWSKVQFGPVVRVTGPYRKEPIALCLVCATPLQCKCTHKSIHTYSLGYITFTYSYDMYVCMYVCMYAAEAVPCTQ